MFIYALAALFSMIGIGFFVALIGVVGDKYDVSGMIGIISCIIIMCIIFMMGFKTKKKFQEQGLL